MTLPDLPVPFARPRAAVDVDHWENPFGEFESKGLGSVCEDGIADDRGLISGASFED